MSFSPLWNYAASFVLKCSQLHITYNVTIIYYTHMQSTYVDLFRSSKYSLPTWSNLWLKCYSTTSLSDVPACCSRICCDTQLMASGQQFCQWKWLCISVDGYVVPWRNFQNPCAYLYYHVFLPFIGIANGLSHSFTRHFTQRSEDQ